jgi:hypothetical protein
MPQSHDELTSHRLDAMAADLKDIKSTLLGNGKPGLRERVGRLELGVLVMLVMLATSTPVASAIVTALKH